MFARRVTIQLEPESVPESTRQLETDVIPLLHEQNGFEDELTFVTKGDRDAVAIGVWDRQAATDLVAATAAVP